MALPYDKAGSDAGPGLAIVQNPYESTEGWQVWHPDDIHAELPAIEWIVQGLAPRGSLGMLSAYGASLKSWLALDLCDAVTNAREFLGRFPVSRTGDAFYVDFEAGDYELRRRIQAIRSVGGGTRAGSMRMVTMPSLYLHARPFLQRIEIIARHNVVVVVDTLSAGSPGVDQNDAKFAEPLVKLKSIAARTGCCIVVLHHNRKTTPGRDDDPREVVRGTSAVYNALDWGLGIFRDKSGKFLARQIKSRNGKEVEDFYVQVVDDAPGHSRVSATDADTVDDCNADLVATLLDHVGKLESAEDWDSLSSRNALCKSFGHRKTIVLALLGELVTGGQMWVMSDGGLRLTR